MAKRFASYHDDADVVIFASGVSDSKTNDSHAFEREEQLLRQTLAQYPEALMVYFSTCSIYDPFLVDKSYVKHKLNMEHLLQQSGHPYLICRVSNVAGPGGNPKTIFHYLAGAVLEERSFPLWKHAYRNLIDVDDVYALVKWLIDHGTKNEIINIAHPVSFTMPEIMAAYLQHFHRQGHHFEIEAGHHFPIDTSTVEAIAASAGVNFGGNYLYRLLEKYYPTA
jgi:nucleoside-diphosphate-sugar epimerase